MQLVWSILQTRDDLRIWPGWVIQTNTHLDRTVRKCKNGLRWCTASRKQCKCRQANTVVSNIFQPCGHGVQVNPSDSRDQSLSHIQKYFSASKFLVLWILPFLSFWSLILVQIWQSQSLIIMNHDSWMHSGLIYVKTSTSWQSVQNYPKMIYMSCQNHPQTCQNKATTPIPWLFDLPRATLPSSTSSALRCAPQWIALMTGKASLWCSRATPSKPCICHRLAWWSDKVNWVHLKYLYAYYACIYFYVSFC